jgi:hypothetical protein
MENRRIQMQLRQTWIGSLIALGIVGCTGSEPVPGAKPVTESPPLARATEDAVRPTPTDGRPEKTEQSDLIRLDVPIAHAHVSSPLHISGQARGSYFFEGSFPVTVRDQGGNVLGRGFAKAQGEWMTQNFVAFAGELTFDAKGATEGTLLLKQDDPSDGESKRPPAELVVPVLFK